MSDVYPMKTARERRDGAVEELRSLLEGKINLLRRLESVPIEEASKYQLRIETEQGNVNATGHSIDMIKVSVGNLSIVLRWCQNKLISCILQTTNLYHSMGLFGPHYNDSVRTPVTSESTTGIGGIDEITVSHEDITAEQISSITEIIEELLQKLTQQTEGKPIEPINAGTMDGFRKRVAGVLNAYGRNRGEPEITL